MTIRERIQTALRGGTPDQVPWTAYRGLLPDDDALIARLQSEGLGIIQTCGAYAIEQPGLESESEAVTYEGEPATRTVWRTADGELSQITKVDSGYGSSWIVEHFVKTPADYETLAALIGSWVIKPSPDPFTQADQQVGDSGIVMGSLMRAPLQRLWIQFTGIERLSMDLLDAPEAVERVLTAMRAKDEEVLACVADGEAEFIWCPDNISGEVTGPPWFKQYLAPYYDTVAAHLHPKGKKIVAHMDGMLRRLKDRIAATPVDVVEAFTPAPDTDLTLAEAREAWPDKALWINFPSSVHLESPERIRQHTIKLLREAAPGAGFAISVTENIPAEVAERSLIAITDTINEFGTCPLAG